FFFFFSSRRRHTRWPRDWSSDVCSSDLHRAHKLGIAALGSVLFCRREQMRTIGRFAQLPRAERACELLQVLGDAGSAEPPRDRQIGRASCRERGENAVVVGELEKEKEVR